MDSKRKEVANALERLVHRRFNEQGLNDELTRIFGTEIKARETEFDDDWSGDWCYTFDVEDGELSGWFDLYFLKMREQPQDNDDGLRFYITEVVIGFDKN